MGCSKKHSFFFFYAENILKGKFTVTQVFFKDQEKSQTTLTQHLIELEEEQTNHKVSRKKEITKNQEGKIRFFKIGEKINKTRS